MLTELRIENLAIIQELSLRFREGLITFTGETGAGKSIIIDAIEALVGGRADLSLIRSGAERAVVEAVFSVNEDVRQPLFDILQREDLVDDPNFIQLSRELKKEGRSTARVNGRSVNVTILKEIGALLIDIHGQSEHLSLLNVKQHLSLVDRYALVEQQIEEYQQIYKKMRQIRKQLNDLQAVEAESARRMEFLTFQIDEINNARLKPGEDEELVQERDRLANAEHISEAVQQGLLLLDEATPDTASILDMVGELQSALMTLQRFDVSSTNLVEHVDTIADLLGDITHELRGYQDQIEFNPKRLEVVEHRLALISDLKRKYGKSINQILAYQEKAAEDLDQITHASENIEEFQTQIVDLEKQLAERGVRLHQKRSKAAEKLSKAVENELKDLSMPSARFNTAVQYNLQKKGIQLPDGEQVAADETGFDLIEFQIAPNPGEGFSPLAKIASGGEMARIMLALKNVLTSQDQVPTLIFDEIDQGIGGRLGMVVGEKLWQLGRNHQVFCVTHMAQLAAYSDVHYRVQKQTQEGRTLTTVEVMQGDDQLNELAQMLGSLNNANRQAAAAALQEAYNRRIALQNSYQVVE
ncbi:MAG: DNA repair protein RecN [Anaerolineaceae bacterium]|nr:DNA repair protein RecN [Anaerolineaceae bacterium]